MMANTKFLDLENWFIQHIALAVKHSCTKFDYIMIIYTNKYLIKIL